jgi:PAS domain S-box-containing protein
VTPQEILHILALSPNATSVYSGHDIIIETANDAMLALWGKDRSVIGKPMAEAIPELKGQPFLGILKEVVSSGITYKATDTKAMLMRNGILEAFYFDFVYEAVISEDGKTYILHTASDVTERHFAKQEVITLHQNLSAVNQKLSAANELSEQANLALAASQQLTELQRKNLYDFFMQAPTGICILVGEELIFELVNPRYQQLLPGRILIGQPIFEALPELIGQPVADILKEVFTTGTEANVNEMLIPVRSAAGIFEDRYFTCNVQPRRNLQGGVDGIFNFVYEVTEQVKARRAVEERELHFKHLADLVPAKISNALPTGEVTFFNRHWLDFSGLSFEDTRDFGYHQMMHPDEIAGFQSGLYEAAAQGKAYINEMRFKNTEGEYIWHLNIASPILDENGAITMWVGSTTDIQRLKEEEQRKSDFISMLSHELKTPITSIKGYIQLFHSIVNEPGSIEYALINW